MKLLHPSFLSPYRLFSVSCFPDSYSGINFLSKICLGTKWEPPFLKNIYTMLYLFRWGGIWCPRTARGLDMMINYFTVSNEVLRLVCLCPHLCVCISPSLCLCLCVCACHPQWSSSHLHTHTRARERERHQEKQKVDNEFVIFYSSIR